jgi:5-methylcytosine-specific restriction endonuclease McrA
MKCQAEGCDRDAAKSMRLCWKHDYLNRYWTNSEFREKRKATKRTYGRKRLQIKRDIIANALGGWKCVECGITDREVLTFDHKDGGGEVERNQMGGQFPTINYYYMHLVEARLKLQVLCSNCNWRKNSFDHSGRGKSSYGVGFRKMRSGLIELLKGPKCVGCGELDERVLTIDHIHGGGTTDRNLRGGIGSLYRYYLAHPEVARENLQVLCRNCNWKKHRTRAGVRYPGATLGSTACPREPTAPEASSSISGGS